MKLIDLTHTINKETPVYPGMARPDLRSAAYIDRDGYRETSISMYSHTGTHMDAPSHVLKDGATLDNMDISAFTGRAVTIDCRLASKSMIIGEDMLRQYESDIQNVDFVMLYTNWDAFWRESKYIEEYPVPDTDAVKYLLDLGVRGIGLDTVSIDPTGAALENHHEALSRGAIIIENLMSLDLTLGHMFTLWALPIKYAAADGAPIRAVAVINS